MNRFLSACSSSGKNLPNIMQPVLLAIVAQAPLHSCVIAQRVIETGFFPDQSDVTIIYRMLNSMASNGILAQKEADSPTVPNLKLYAITPLGRECLRNWIRAFSAHHERLTSILTYLFNIKTECSACEADLPADPFFEAAPPAGATAPKTSHAESPREALVDALERCRGNKSKAARELGISRTELYNRLREFSLS